MDPILLLSGLILFAFGLLGVTVAEPSLLPQHLLRVGFALLALLLGALLPPRLLLRQALPLLLLTLLLLALVLVLGEGPGGVRRWFDLGPLSFQPSELAKVSLVVYLASFVERRGHDYPILGPVLAVGLMAGLVLLEPAFSTAAFLLGLAFLLLVLVGVPWRRLLAITLAASLVLLPFSGLYFNRFPYISERLLGHLAYLQGEGDPRGEAYQLLQAKKAILLGGPLGQGPGGRLPHLPEAHNDMIFASVVFATGWLGGVGVLFLFLLILARGANLALKVQGGEGVLALGLALELTLQAALSAGIALGPFPVTGMPFPFLSYGGSNLFFSGLALGILGRIAWEADQRGVRG